MSHCIHAVAGLIQEGGARLAVKSCCFLCTITSIGGGNGPYVVVAMGPGQFALLLMCFAQTV